MVGRKSLLIALLALFTAACSAPTLPAEMGAATASSESADLPPASADNALPPETSQLPDPYLMRRQAMVKSGIAALGIKDEAVLSAMETVPRHLFVPDMYLDQAYENHPLPIGFGQTISQPYIVALMTEAAEVGSGEKVLEVGTGSGYQAAVLAEIVDQVYTVEIVGALAKRARTDIARAGYENVIVQHADGYYGWAEFAPYDAIIVTAAPDHIPPPLVQQLKVGGQLIIPVGPIGGVQTLWRVTRVSEDEVRSENLGAVRFVPFTREERQE